MKAKPRWISKQALLLLHEESLAQFGGARGVADEGLLDSALARPHHTHAYKPESTLAELAASCAYGLARNHPFVDGNKRVAFLSIGIFLAINGYRLVRIRLMPSGPSSPLRRGNSMSRPWLPGLRRTA